MKTNAFSVSLEKNPEIAIKVIPGHFTTSNLHVNYFLDVWELKSKASLARDVARELAAPYLVSTPIDTIVCMERTVVLGAYLAEELLREGTAVMNAGGNIHIVTPLSNVNGNLIFQDNAIQWIRKKNILLLVASISSGKTIKSAMECIAYYEGRLAGISALFFSSEKLDYNVNALFTSKDIPGYQVFSTVDCAMCKAGQKLNAIISSEGYTKIE
jgi:orotate phosphoribosyltransferase